MPSSLPSAQADAQAAQFAHKGLLRLLWRLHFWAGLVTAPLVLLAACTGLLYVFTPQIEARLYGHLDQVRATANPQPLDAQLAVARATQQGQMPRSITVPAAADRSTQFLFAAAAGHEHHAGQEARVVYVDPADARVLGQLPEGERFKNWARRLHSTLLQGEGWRWLIEGAASWLLVMLASGLVMWWPRSQGQGGPGWRALLPRWGRGRLTWRDLHASVAIAMGAVLVVLLVTGLTWSRFTGENFRAAQQALGQASPKPPKGLRSERMEGLAPLSTQAVYAVARGQMPGSAIALTPPTAADGVWRADSVVAGQPGQRLSLLIDAGTGRVLYRSGWDQLPVLAKGTAVGIPFHRGELGLWNQTLLALAALAVIFSVVSGLVMWWRRRPAGRLAAPAVSARQLRAVPIWLWMLALALGLAMPVFGLSALVFLALELLAAAARRAYLPSSSVA